jgi:hypothetical protein
MGDWLLRFRALVDKQFAVIVIALMMLVLVGGWFTYTAHISPPATTEESQAPSWQTVGQFNHSATVTEDNPVYPVETTLANQPIYFAEIAPQLNGTYAFTYGARENGDLNGNVTLQLVFRSVTEDREDTATVWQTTNPLGETSAGSLEPGDTIHVPFSVDMDRAVNRTEVINEELGNPPGQTEVMIRATVDIQGTVNGQSVDQNKEHTLPIAYEQGTYRPAQQEPLTEQHEATRTVSVKEKPGQLRRIGAPALLFMSLIALTGLGIARSRGELALSSVERELLKHEDDRQDFEEWISTIELPDEAFNLPKARAKSLGDLVDVAIDTNNTVIEDPDRDAYYVVHGDYLYTYCLPKQIHSENLDTQAGEEAASQTDGENGVSSVHRTSVSDSDEEPSGSSNDAPSEE